MKIFLSWHNRKSKEVALFLSKWLKVLINQTEPWISRDIEKGRKGDFIISKELESTKFGIFCLDKSNLNSTWMHFEAGAIAKTIEDSNLCTFLLDIESVDVPPPLGNYQHTIFDKEDVLKLVKLIRDKTSLIHKETISKEQLVSFYELLWPQLEKGINSILDKDYEEDIEFERPISDIVKEILRSIRSLDSDINKMSRDFITTSELIYSVFNDADEEHRYLTKRLAFSNKVRDLTWASFNSHDKSNSEKRDNASELDSYILKMELIYKQNTDYDEIFIFKDNEEFRTDRLKKLKYQYNQIKKGKSSKYSCSYFDKTVLPRLQFTIIDDDEIVFTSSNNIKCKIQNKELVDIFKIYYEEAYEKSVDLIHNGKVISEELILKLIENIE